MLPPDAAATLAQIHARSGDRRHRPARRRRGVPIAGKTGTAELADAPSHAWFIGFAPYGAGARKIAFSVLVENGVYGGTAAAPGRRRDREAAARNWG